jgi:hemerythrin-like domain-containing protein
MGKATRDLIKEHDAILHVLHIMDKMISPGNTRPDSVKLRYGKEVVHFLKVFADKCHHGKEESYLFWELVDRGVRNEGGPIGVMLQEHKLARGFIAGMNISVESRSIAGFNSNAIKYRDLLRNHIANENKMLFVIADRLLDEAAQDALFEKFEKHEKDVIGHGVHKEMYSMIDRWSDEFNIHLSLQR